MSDGKRPPSRGEHDRAAQGQSSTGPVIPPPGAVPMYGPRAPFPRPMGPPPMTMVPRPGMGLPPRGIPLGPPRGPPPAGPSKCTIKVCLTD